MTIFRRALGGATPPIALLLAGSALAQTAPAPQGQPIAPKEQANPTAAAPLSESYPGEGAGDGVTSGGYNQSRWVENWTRFRDPKKRDDVLDRLKYIPIDGDGDVYLTLSGEFRLRVNATTNPNLREGEAQRQDINRIVGGADLHIGPHFRAYGEIAHGGLAGQNLGTITGTMRNDLIVQQSFVDATAQVDGIDVGIRYGRQTFADGPNLMVVPRDNNTIFFVYNGVRAWTRGKTLRADVFDYYTTALGLGGTSDDNVDKARRFSGVSTGVVLPTSLFGGSKLYLDPFVWRLRNRNALWGRTTAREERSFYGMHLYGDAGPVNLDWTVNYQGGSYNSRNLSAWQVFAAQTYRLGKDKAAPRIGIHADYGSGGGSFGTGTLRTALAPFGNNIYYSYQLFATPTNFIAVAPNFTVTPLKGVRATIEYQWSWRDDVRDAVYRANGTAFAGTQNVTARKIADTTRAQVVWTITPRVSVTGRYEHLQAGPSLTRAGFASSDFFAGWLSLRF